MERFPAKLPAEKPNDMELSTAMERLYDFWDSKAEYENEFYTRFKYSGPEGFPDDGFISGRDPSKVIKVGDLYYVYNTCRNTGNSVVASGKDDEKTPSTDWDLADIYVATSRDGFTWEERGAAFFGAFASAIQGRTSKTDRICYVLTVRHLYKLPLWNRAHAKNPYIY